MRRYFVSWQHIRQGWRCSPSLCPVALAVKATGVRCLVSNSILNISSWHGHQTHYKGKPPLRVRLFLKVFDAFGIGLPFSFQVPHDP